MSPLIRLISIRAEMLLALLKRLLALKLMAMMMGLLILRISVRRLLVRLVIMVAQLGAMALVIRVRM